MNQTRSFDWVWLNEISMSYGQKKGKKFVPGSSQIDFCENHTLIKIVMKYFVLNPKSKFKGDPYARASRAAMVAYAEAIAQENGELCCALKMWATEQASREKEMKEKP